MTENPTHVTQHAIERLMVRSACLDAGQAGETLLRMAARALPWRSDKNQWHSPAGSKYFFLRRYEELGGVR